MGKRQLQVATSDDEDDEPKHADKKQKLKADSNKLPDAKEENGEEEVPPEDAKPVGDVIKSVGKGKKRRKHYNSFEYEGNIYEMEDPVLITPEDKPQKPYAAIIKDVSRGLWPDAAVQAITTLEKASHDSLGSDFQKYNKKMRQLVFNLKNSVALSRRLLNKELDPVVIVNMSPNELKDGLTAEEKTTKEPEESKRVQMTDARCSRCTEKKVCVAEIIHASHGDRYQLECMACGYTWCASHDAISSLTIDTPSAAGNVGTAPWATAKFEDVERKKLVSPRESEKPDVVIFQKSTAAYMPVLDVQKSLNKSKTDELEAQKSLNKSKTDDPPVSAVSHNDKIYE